MARGKWVDSAQDATFLGGSAEILAACLATESAAQVDLRSSVFSFATTQR
jgi:hypothetical protein